jgi:hypothetical protein
MAALNFTPISLYYSTTASAAPSAGNLVAGELALNTLDEKLYFKNSAGTVKLLASNSASSGTVSSVAATVPAFLSIAGSPITTSGTLAITYSGTALPVANGGTGLTSGTSGGVLAYTATGTLASSGALTQYGVVIGGGAGAAPTSTAVGTATHVLTSNGAGVAPTFQAPAASGVTTFTAGTTGFTPSSATSGAVTLAGTLATTNGGTGLTSFTSGGVVYASSTSALATGSTLSFTGTNLGLGTASPAFTNFSATTTGLEIKGANTYGALRLGGATGEFYIVSGGTAEAWLWNYSNSPMIFATNNVERARITSTGGFVVGTSTDPGAGIIADANGNVRKIPQSGSAKTTSYTLTTGDIGEYILLGASGAVVIPDAVFSAGDVVSIFNNTASTATITCTITTAYIAGTFTDKATMTLAAAGVATILFITGTTCVVSGNVT